MKYIIDTETMKVTPYEEKTSPAPTGTDGSEYADHTENGLKSRPYGDGWFCQMQNHFRKM